MLAVNDLFYLASPMVSSLFLEDVVAWLDENGIRYTPNVKFTGKSGYDHLFDFVIPKSKKRPERILQAINRPSRDEAGATAFAWIDTREVRASDSRAYACSMIRKGWSPLRSWTLSTATRFIRFYGAKGRKRWRNWLYDV
ncbi:MAG TPA: DUF1829 domain-containing protein [Methanothrix soehngenii]|nr:DUF1829 domain-containing protein [Methanothrix soehngenii]